MSKHSPTHGVCRVKDWNSTEVFAAWLCENREPLACYWMCYHVLLLINVQVPIGQAPGHAAKRHCPQDMHYLNVKCMPNERKPRAGRIFDRTRGVISFPSISSEFCNWVLSTSPAPKSVRLSLCNLLVAASLYDAPLCSGLV